MNIEVTPEFSEMEFSISEIFYSIQGEGTRAGLPCVFVRLQGCNNFCKWCDTVYAQDVTKKEMIITAEELIEKIISYDCKFVELTGGEPLLQKNVLPVMEFLCDLDYTVALETNGTLDVCDVDPRVIKIIDVKTPSSDMSAKNNYEIFNNLQSHDEIKFVILDREDYIWAKDILLKYNIAEHAAAVLFSPVFGELPPEKLASWILEDRLPVRLQLQLHKYIWAPGKRGV